MPFEPQAAKDLDLSFRFSDLPNYRGDSHWTYLQLEVFHPSQEGRMGYLRVAYISREMGEAINQNRLLYLQLEGHSIYTRNREHALSMAFSDPKTWDNWKHEPRNAARHVMETVMRMSYGKWNESLRDKSTQQLVNYVETHRPQLNEQTQEGVENMFAFAVNKADVDYIYLDETLRGKGFSQYMYEGMARYLDEHLGITLNCSTTQTHEANRCWEKMIEKGMATRDAAGRMFFCQGIRESTLNQRDVLPGPVAIASRKRPGLK